MQDRLIMKPSHLGPSVRLKTITTFPRYFRVIVLTSSSLSRLYFILKLSCRIFPLSRRRPSKLHTEVVCSYETSIDFCKITRVPIVEILGCQKVVKTLFRTTQSLVVWNIFHVTPYEAHVLDVHEPLVHKCCSKLMQSLVLKVK
jgi:hypothetical protein